MVENFECAVSDLLYAENTNRCSVDLGCNSTHDTGSSHSLPDQNNFIHSGNPRLLMGLPVQSEEIVELFHRESEHLPDTDYLHRLQNGQLDLSVRRDALEWIWKAYAHYSFGPSTVCLSINYMDRFLSAYELPRGKYWTVQLLAVACLSLAAKMEEPIVPHPVDLQVGEPKYVFEGKTIHRMELLVLSTLKWRMYAITPCSFISFYLTKVNGGLCPSTTSIDQSLELILSAIRGIDVLEFKPSEIAAAIAIYVSEAITALENEAMACLKNVDKGRVLKCVELIKDVSLAHWCGISGIGTVSSVPKSPDAVLDGACLSYKSDDLTVGSCANSSHNNANSERKKPDDEDLKS